MKLDIYFKNIPTMSISITRSLLNQITHAFITASKNSSLSTPTAIIDSLASFFLKSFLTLPTNPYPQPLTSTTLPLLINVN